MLMSYKHWYQGVIAIWLADYQAIELHYKLGYIGYVWGEGGIS